MIRKEVALRLMSAGYMQSVLDSPDTFWYNKNGKCIVQIHYGGHVCIWYKKHPIHWCWDGEARCFFDRV